MAIENEEDLDLDTPEGEEPDEDATPDGDKDPDEVKRAKLAALKRQTERLERQLGENKPEPQPVATQNAADNELAEQVRKLAAQQEEILRAMANKPQPPSAGPSGSGPVVKDNVFSEQQIAELTRRAERLGVKPDEFIENMKKNLLG